MIIITSAISESLSAIDSKISALYFLVAKWAYPKILNFINAFAKEVHFGLSEKESTDV
ncbi:hypothetical protein KAM336_17790 [Aeromonas caviae]|nr:hypothetical protein KAM336_17790 [Aeromonas caviae]